MSTKLSQDLPPSPFETALAFLEKPVWGVALFCLILYVIMTFRFVEALPDPPEILHQLYRQPEQTETDFEPFVKEYAGKQYEITPRFAYDLNGLILSYRNHDESWFHLSYKKDPYNIKDVCVIWGSNLEHKDYLQADFSSGMWTCYFQFKSRISYFKEDEASNNHILPATEEVARELKRARTGDQIHFVGFLVDYKVLPDGGQRTSSTTRYDKGGWRNRNGVFGACEVVYVEKFEILKRRNSVWRAVQTLSWYGFWLALIVKLLAFLFCESKPKFF